MRKGARWYSLETAAMTTYTGSTLIQFTSATIGKIGKLLELDTDGIWCLLPAGFPEKVQVQMKNGKNISIDWIMAVCNEGVYQKWGNP